jgi:L-2,4-diaminobutyrate decarboxylase
VAVWSEGVISALNNSVAVREMSPVLTYVEDRVIGWLCGLVGFPAAGPGVRPGGTLTSGGTEASFTGLLAARNAAVPDAWAGGVGADAGVIVAGEHAHYAIGRAAGELGLGTRNAIAVPSRGFRMDVEALEARLAALAAERRRVIAVVATAGSTATGSFDDLEAIASTCERHGAWLHVDGAHGASALLAARHRHRLKGIERARTVAWDPHKAMLLPLSAGALLARDETDLERAFAQQAPYLFHAGEGGRQWDQGLRSFACSRRGDALKVWVAFQRHGADGIGLLYDHLCAMATAFHEQVVEHPDFEAVHVPESNILCFRYAPAGVPADRLDELNWQLREAWNRSGKGWITTTVLEGRRVLRVTVMNPRTALEHVSATISGLAGLGQALR